MIVFAASYAFAILFTFAGVSAIAHQERRRETTRPNDRAQQQNTSQRRTEAHRGDFSALAAGSIEGKAPMYEDGDTAPALPMWAAPDRTPSVRVGSDRSTFVAAPRVVQAPTIDATPTNIEGVWQPSAHVAETGTPIHRALATVIRAAPIMLLMAIVSVPIAWYIESGWMLGIAIVGLCTLIGYLAVLYIDLSWNSPGSIEAKRISAAYRLRRMELKQSHELRRAIVEAWLERQEKDV